MIHNPRSAFRPGRHRPGFSVSGQGLGSVLRAGLAKPTLPPSPPVAFSWRWATGAGTLWRRSGATLPRRSDLATFLLPRKATSCSRSASTCGRPVGVGPASRRPEPPVRNPQLLRLVPVDSRAQNGVPRALRRTPAANGRPRPCQACRRSWQPCPARPAVLSLAVRCCVRGRRCRHLYQTWPGRVPCAAQRPTSKLQAQASYQTSRNSVACMCSRKLSVTTPGCALHRHNGRLLALGVRQC